MPINARVIPEWTDFVSRLEKTIQQRERQSDGFNQNDEEDTLLLNVHPSIQFHYSCVPLHHLHCITSYSGCGSNVVLGFKWGQTEFKHQIDTWVDDGQGNLQHHSTVPVYGRYKIELMQFIPNRGMLVGYCNDMHLRILTDKTQEMVVLCQTECPASVASMHYCPETNELLTGSMGFIAFWGFYTSAQSPLSLLRTLDWTSGAFQRNAIITTFVSQRQTNSIYVLCDHSVKSFENTGEKELFEFRGQSHARLRCAVAEWRQRYLYTGDAEGYMQVWSHDTRCLFLQFRAHPEAVTSLLLLPESGTILSASTGCWIKQWSRTGELLLKLHTDMTGVQSMWKLGENVVLCQSSNSLDVWRLNSVYRSFNDTACDVRVLQRLDCGGGKARILAVTQDGIIRFFSPVTGELLFLSWPFLHIDKALSFAYDPLEEELYICDGSVEVLVLNTTLNPCPVKHIINTIKDSNDGVLCLATLLLLQDGAGSDGPRCLVFSGHCNGKLQLLAPLGLSCMPKQAHTGAICQMTSCNAGNTPLICCYGTDHQFTLWSVTFGEREVDLILCHQINCPFNPVHCRALKGFVCAVSPQQNLIFYSVHGGMPTVIERKRSERISCLDYCPQLDVIAVSGQSGKMEIWNPKGDLVSEVQLGVPVRQVCFGNTRGDILAAFSDSISIMSVIDLLPASYLRSVLLQAPKDDITEHPIPFLPRSPSHYEINSVAKIYVNCVKMGSVASETILDQFTRDTMAEEDTFATEVQKDVIRKSVVRPFTFRRQSAHPNTPPTISEQEPGEMNEVSGEALKQAESFDDTFFCLFSQIAPDGYIPNSVVRALHIMEQGEEEEEEEERKWYKREEEESASGLPAALHRGYDDIEEDLKHSKAIEEILTRSKLTRRQNAQQQAVKVETSVQEEEEVQDTEILEDMNKKMVIKKLYTMMADLNTSSEDDYREISGKLLSLLREIPEDQSVMDKFKETFESHVMDSSIIWRQLKGLQNLRRLCLLQRSDVGMISGMLTHNYPELRDLAGTILNTEFNICDKQALRNELHRSMSPTDLDSLLDKLTDDLKYIEGHNSVVTSNIQRSKITGARTNKPSTASLSQMSRDTKARRGTFRKNYYKYLESSTEDLLGEKVDQTAEEKKHTQIPTGRFRTTMMTGSATTKSKTKRGPTVHTNRGAVSALRRFRFSPDNPLLYAFRKSHALSPMEFAMPKYESRLLPIDSGFISLRNQEVSSKQLPTGERGILMPIGKPKKVISEADHLTSQHTSHTVPHPSPEHSQHHFGSIENYVISQPRYDTSSQHIRDTYCHFEVSSQGSHDNVRHSDIISHRPPDTNRHYVVDSQDSHDDVRHSDISSHRLPDTNRHYVVNSQDSFDNRQHYDATSQHSFDPEHHYEITSQYPHDTQIHSMNSQHSHDPTQNCAITSQHPYQDTVLSDIVPNCPSNRAEHPQSPSDPSQRISQYPQSTSQRDPKPLPHHASQTAGRPCERDEVREQGQDTHWRESLQKLISLYGFRSRKAARAAASLCVQPLRPLRQRVRTALPPLCCRPPWPAAAGERVLERAVLTEGGGSSTPLPLQFQHEIPLPWRLSHFPLRPRGQTRYGKLEMDWVRSEAGRLPKIDPKRSLIQS